MTVATKLSGAFLLVAAAICCFPQVGSASSAPAGPPSSVRAAIAVRTTSIHPARTISPTLIPPLVIHPSVRSVRVAALPRTGSSHALLTSMLGLGLIGLGVLVLFLQSLGSAPQLAVKLHQIRRRMA